MAADLKSAQQLLLSCLIVFLFCRHIPLVNCKLECFATVNVTKENGENGCDPNFQVEAKFETASMCCLGNGFWFRNTNDSDECMQCIVFGFTEESYSVNEGDHLDLTTGTIKGISDRSALFQATVVYESATGNDLVMNNYVTRLLRGEWRNNPISMQIRTDNIAAENEETVCLKLHILRSLPLRSNEFVKDTVRVHIWDTTDLSFSFTEDDYIANERDGYIELGITKTTGVKLANPVSIVVTPLTLTEAISNGISTAHTEIAAATEADFGYRLEVVFHADERASSSEDLKVKFPIVNDDINEAEEAFVVYLDVSNDTNSQGVSTSSRRSSLSVIDDNDNIEIGFERGTLSFEEGVGSFTIYIKKFPPGRTTEQDFEMVVFAYQSGSSLEQLQTEFGISGETVIRFLSTEGKKQFELNIQSDDVAEYTKELTLSILPATAAGGGNCQVSSGCNSAVSVQIMDDDGIQVGFTETSVEVLESTGTATVCVSISEDTVLEVFLSLAVEAKSGSAVGGDFLPKQYDVELDAANRRECLDVSIIDDSYLEEKETIIVTLYQLESAGDLHLPLLTINPAIVIVSIVDDDYEVGFEQERYSVNESDRSAQICAVLHGHNPKTLIQVALTVVYLEDGASAEDISSSSARTTMNFGSSNEMRQCITINLVNDILAEDEEHFQVQMEAITIGLELGITSATIVIVDDDVTIGLERDEYTVEEGTGEIEVCAVVKSGAVQRDAVLSFCTEMATAIDLYDFEPVQSQITFTRGGDSRLCRVIQIINDDFKEQNQTLVVRLERTSTTDSGLHVNPRFASISILDDDGVLSLNESCDPRFASFVNEQEKKREKAVETIVTVIGLAPELVFNSSNSSDSSNSVIRVVYTSLSEKFHVTPSEVKFNKFVEAVTEISTAEEEACSGSVSLSTADIPEIVAKFNRAFSAGRNSDITEIRAIYGQMLCVKREEQAPDTKRRKRSFHHCPMESNCGCPPSGLTGGEITCTCHFFGCLDPDKHLEPIFGFIEFDLPCLAFVIDTTGSMATTIEGAIATIKEFVGAEEDLGFAGCYLLVPFNDVGPDDANVADASVGPITIAYTYEVSDLLTFYDNLERLYAYGGGDGPEYSLDGMLRALQFKYGDDYGTLSKAMVEGSQMIMLTDAPSKNQEIESSVINLAKENRICIHCFVSGSYGTDDGLYQRVAEGTSGTLVTPFSNWQVSAFTSSYRDSNFCSFESRRRKRAAIAPTSRCHSFHISVLSILFRFSGETYSSVTFTRPSGTTIEVFAGAGVLVHSERYPEPGEWLACLGSGDFKFSVDQDYSLDITLGYLKNTDTERLVASINPPTECSAGQIMLSTSRSSLIVQPRLSMLDSDRNVVQTVHLTKCSGSFVANMSFPRGEYTYLLEGVDTSGVGISYHVGKKVVFRPGEYQVVASGDTTIEIDRSDTFNFSFSISNLNSHASKFDFSTISPGFTATLRNKSVSLSPGETMNIVVVSWVSSSSVQKGSTHIIEVQASNGCVTLSDTKTVMIKAAGTPPTADVCGCQNGGTCVVRTIRGRVFKKCLCPPGYRGKFCETERV